MSTPALTIDIRDGASPRLRAFLAGLTGTDRLHASIAQRALTLTHSYFSELAATRHATANALGATPTGHWSQAADRTTVTSDAAGVTLSIDQPGIGRAAHEVTITPSGGRQFLTIPLTAASYGRPAENFPDLFVLRPQQSHALFLAHKEGDDLSLLYALVRDVTQPQDRTLLPSDEDYTQAALSGVSDYLASLPSGQTP